MNVPVQWKYEIAESLHSSLASVFLTGQLSFCCWQSTNTSTGWWTTAAIPLFSESGKGGYAVSNYSNAADEPQGHWQESTWWNFWALFSVCFRRKWKNFAQKIITQQYPNFKVKFFKTNKQKGRNGILSCHFKLSSERELCGSRSTSPSPLNNHYKSLTWSLCYLFQR